eukprot:Nk52_evm1s240 gene=Nk52_evmTU1s240
MSAVTIDKISFKDLTFSSIKTNAKGGKTVYVNYNNGPVLLRVPALFLPFGVSSYDQKDGSTRFSLELSFKGFEENASVRAAKEWFEKFDSDFREYVYEHKRSEWLKKPEASREIVQELVAGVVKYPKDPETGAVTTKYAPTVRAKLSQTEDGSFDSRLFEDKRVSGKHTEILLDAGTLGSTIPKGSRVESILRLASMYFLGNKIGFSFKFVQGKILKSSFTEISGCMFDGDDEENDCNVGDGQDAMLNTSNTSESCNYSCDLLDQL